MIRYLFLSTIKKYARLIISMIIISSLGIGMVAGFSGSYKTLDKSLNGFVSDYSYADITINIEPADKENFDFLYSDDRIDTIDLRLIMDVLMRTKNNKNFSVRAASVSPDSFQKYYLWEENKKPGYVNVAVDHKFAVNNNLHAGDIVKAKLDGKYRRFCISKVVSYAENLTVIRDKYSWGENTDFGYFYFDEDELKRTDYSGTRNQVIICLKDEFSDKRQEISDEIVHELEDRLVSVKDSNVYEDSTVYKSIEANLRTMKNLSLLTPGLFFICMLIVIWLFMSQIIVQCRREIGILKALGFRNGKIAALYSSITFLITVIGSIVGIIIGVIVENFILDVYQDFFSLPGMQHSNNSVIIVSAILLTVIIGQAATLLSIGNITTVSPTEAMTRLNIKSIRKKAIELKTHNLKHIDLKYSAISVLRNKKRFAFSVLCIAASFTIIFVSLSFNNSKEYVLNQMCGDYVNYDCQLFFEEQPDDDILNDLKKHGAYNIEQLNYSDVIIQGNGKSDNTILCGVKSNTALARVFDENMNCLNISDEGIILEKHLAEKLGVGRGDYVELFGKQVMINDISYHPICRIQYVSLNQFNELTAADNYSVICNTDNAEKLSDYATEKSNFHYSNIMEHIRESNIRSFKTYSVGVIMLIVFAVLLGFQTVFNTIQMDLYEQKRELSVLRSLGFRVSRISKIQSFKQIAEYVLACLIGLPSGIWFAKFALSGMSTDVREYPFVSTPYLYIATYLIVMAYMIIGHLFANRKIKKWDIVENIKEKE